MFNLQAVGDNFLVILVFIFAPVSGYLVYEAFRTRDHASILKEENAHLKEDYKRMERTDKVQSEFVGIATHQLRTPLAKMKWSLLSLVGELEEKLTPSQKELFEVAKESNEKMIRLVEDLLGVKETEDSRLGYDFKTTNLVEVIDSTVKNFSVLAKQKNIGLDFVNTNGSSLGMTIDPWKVGLALGNLIDNAISYTPENGKIEVRLENFGNSVRVSVKDSGIGIPDAEKEKIFTRFFRASNASKIRANGTGLGLYIARNIIKVHGGEIWANSLENKGTTFYFTLPIGGGSRVDGNIRQLMEEM